jgi:chromosome segregation ATPase
MDTQMDDEVPIFDETNYSAWRIEMKGYLKEKGAGVWKEAIGGSVPLKNKSKFAAQKEEKKNDALALKTIFNGLSSSVKESMGQCTSTKDLWLKLEKVYQDKEDNSIKDNEGKDSPKYSNFNTPSEVECSLTNEEEDIVEVCVDEEEELLKFKEKVLSELGDVSMEIGHYSIASEYLEKCINEVLEKYPKHIMELKKMLKEQEESKKTQLEEKEEEIKRLKNEIIIQEEENKKVDDELSKSLEVNVNLKTQIEEAKRIEELLKNQVNEKEESCHKLEAEVVDLRKKVEKSNTHIKFMNSSTILDEILDSQRSPNDKSGLGYNKELLALLRSMN